MAMLALFSDATGVLERAMAADVDAVVGRIASAIDKIAMSTNSAMISPYRNRFDAPAFTPAPSYDGAASLLCGAAQYGQNRLSSGIFLLQLPQNICASRQSE